MVRELDDINVIEFARIISMLQTNTPNADSFDKQYGQKGKRVWWSCQREHLTVWCLHYPVGGVGAFKHTPSESARAMYNNFGRPETLIWLAEALGEDENVIKEVIKEILILGTKFNGSSACKIVRNRISFDRILMLVKKNAS